MIEEMEGERDIVGGGGVLRVITVLSVPIL